MTVALESGTIRTAPRARPCRTTRRSTRARLRPAVLLACTALATVGQSDLASGQQIRGLVLEVTARRPLVEAAVTVLDDRDRQVLQVLTDSAGRFSAALPRAGAYALRVERLGYMALHTEPFEIETAEVIDLEIVAGIEAVPLTPLVVTARRRDVPLGHPDFYRRVERGRSTGWGRFFTREDIERSSFIRTTSLLMNVPAIRLIYTRDGRVLLGASERGGLNCRAAVYFNGMEINPSAGLDQFGLDELEGIEVYRSSNEIPVELARPGVCSAVAFWSRVGSPEGAPLSLRRILIGGAVLTGIVLFGFLN